MHDCSLSLSHELPLSDQVPETVCPAPNGAPPRTHIRRGPGWAPNQPTAEDHLGFHVRGWGRGPEVRGARTKLAEVRPAGLWLGGDGISRRCPKFQAASGNLQAVAQGQVNTMATTTNLDCRIASMGCLKRYIHHLGELLVVSCGICMAPPAGKPLSPALQPLMPQVYSARQMHESSDDIPGPIASGQPATQSTSGAWLSP